MVERTHPELSVSFVEPECILFEDFSSGSPYHRMSHETVDSIKADRARVLVDCIRADRSGARRAVT